MKAREALKEGVLALWEHPGATWGAIGCGALSSLALGAGSAAFRRVTATPGHLSVGITLWLLAATIAALLVGSGLAAVLGALGNVGVNRDERVPLVSPGRGAAVLSLFALERFLYGTLLLAAVAPALRFAATHNEGSPLRLALALAACVAPPLLVLVIALPAFRVAVARTGAGSPSWMGFIEGLGASLRRFPELVALLALTLVASAPLWLLELALGRSIAALHNRALLLAALLLRGACGMLATAWSAAALLALLRPPPIATPLPRPVLRLLSEEELHPRDPDPQTPPAPGEGTPA